MKEAMKNLKVSWNLNNRTLSVTDKDQGVTCITVFRSERKLIDLISETDSATIQSYKWETLNWISKRAFKSYGELGFTIFRLYYN